MKLKKKKFENFTKYIIFGNELMKESERHSLMGICLHFSINSLIYMQQLLWGCGRGVKEDMGQIFH